MKETILLKQKTPMWHFEPDINGCCLRASEVKPKLDRFLLSREKDKLEKYKIGKTDALDYKLSFDVGNSQILDLNGKNFKLFFANIGDGPEKRIIYYLDQIKMNIFSLHDDLIKLVKENLCEFFATHSFGTRQDKGFGYFFPSNKYFGNSFGARYKIEFELAGKKSYVFEETFKHIQYFHKIIRSGINELGVRYKSFMEKYADSKSFIWDKSLIRFYFQCKEIEEKEKEKEKENNAKGKRKSNVNADIIADVDRCKTYSKKILLFRDWLGLASEQEWKSYDDKITIKSTDDKFVRFKSPINYRPVLKKCKKKEGKNGPKYYKYYKVTIYIHFDERGLDDFRNQKFNITSKKHSEASTDLKSVGAYQDFSLSEYFHFILNSYIECNKKNQYINGKDVEKSDEVKNKKVENKNKKVESKNKGKNTKNKVKTKKAKYYIDNIFNPSPGNLSFSEIKKE